VLQGLGDGTIPQTVPTATAPVGKHYKPVSLRRKTEVAIEGHATDIEPDPSWNRFDWVSHAMDL
jgi:hypothetical protein